MIGLQFLPDLSQYAQFLQNFEYPRVFKIEDEDEDKFLASIGKNYVSFSFNNLFLDVRVGMTTNVAEDDTAVVVEVKAENCQALTLAENVRGDLRGFAGRVDSTVAMVAKRVAEQRGVDLTTLPGWSDYLSHHLVATPKVQPGRVARAIRRGLGQRLEDYRKEAISSWAPEIQEEQKTY